MKNRIFEKMLVISTVIMLLVTSIPFNWVAFAEEGGGSGGGLEGGGGTSGVNDVFLDNQNIGLRFSLITLKDGKRQAVKNCAGTYYLDVWMDGLVPSYDGVNSTSRYSPLPTKKNITALAASTFDGYLNDFITNSKGSYGKGEGFNLASMLQPGLASNYIFSDTNSFTVNGQNFYNWFMGTGGKTNGTAHDRYVLVLNWLYYGCMKGLSANSTFLVVEPIINYGNPNSSYQITDPRYVSSWYGYITYNTETKGLDPGRAHTARNRLQKIGSGFKLTQTDYTITSSEVVNLIYLTLGVGIPYADYWCTSDAIQWFGYKPADSSAHAYNHMHKTHGFGMQAYWLEGVIDDAEPIDTYDITNPPSTPAKCEPPSKDNETDGDKTILKLYVDLYQDGATYNTTNKTSTYYTQAIDKGSYIRKDCASDIIISDESDLNGGYKIKAWYTSKSDTQNNTYSGTSMLSTTNSISDTSTDYKVGRMAFKVKGYNALSGLTANGTQRWVDNTGGSLKKTTGANASTFTRTSSNKSTRKTSKDNVHISLSGSEKTLVVLYVKEHGWFDSSSTWDNGGGTPGSTELKIVKCYGVVNPVTYEITEATDKTRKAEGNHSRNVRIKGKDGDYRLAEYVYCGDGSSDWDKMTAAKWGKPLVSPSDYAAQAQNSSFYLKGFIDGFSSTYGSGTYSSQYTWKETKFNQGNSDSTDTITGTMDYVGTYGTGRLSGKRLKTYDKTIYFGGEKMADSTPNNDVLYLIYLKEETVTYEAEDMVIPESFITRHNDFSTNKITVTGNGSKSSTEYKFQEHKFKYSLPIINISMPGEKTWTDPYIVALIHQKTDNAGLVTNWSEVERLTEITPGKYNASSYIYGGKKIYGLAVKDTAVNNSLGIISFSNANYDYVAYRSGDKPTVAQWKHNQLDGLSTSSDDYYNSVMFTAVDSSSFSLLEWSGGYSTLNHANLYYNNNNIVALGNTPKGTRADIKKASHSFDLQLDFTDYYGNEDYDKKIYNVPLNSAQKITDNVGGRLIRKLENYNKTNNITDKHELKSQYVVNLSDLSLTQTVTCDTYYGGAKGSTYTNKSNKISDGSSKGYQTGGYQVLEADNTFTFYPYHVMQIDTSTKWNQYIDAAGNKKADATQSSKSNNQVYVLGEELRQLNCYSYGGVSFSSGSVKRTDNDTINIVNQAFTSKDNEDNDKKGRIQISSEQWSTHARATAATNGMQNCVLPGGASLTLTIPTDNRQTVTVTTYTPLLAGNGLDQVKATGSTGSMPTSLDTSAHVKLVQSVANGLESLNVKQYVIDPTIGEKNLSKLVMDDSGEVIKLPDKNVWDYDKGSLVEPGGKQLSKGTLSTQDKYYFREDGDLDKDNKAIDGLYASNKNGTGVTDGEANTGDLDTSVYDKSTGNINIGSTTTKYYTFYMNRVGEVYCISDSTIDGAAKKANILGKDGDLVAYLDSTTLKPVIVADGIILDIAKKTDIVNQLYTQLEEGTGTDSSAYWSDSNGAWYYEAFDGITIAHMSTDIQVGFIDSYERTSVLDPKLTPSASSKGDILEDYTYSQFKMADHSLLYGTPNKIGEYKVGGTTYNIIVPDLSSLFVSDIFIIPNATVQDLK